MTSFDLMGQHPFFKPVLIDSFDLPLKCSIRCTCNVQCMTFIETLHVIPDGTGLEICSTETVTFTRSILDNFYTNKYMLLVNFVKDFFCGVPWVST